MDKFNTEVEKILKEVYNNPIKGIDHFVKKAIIQTEYRYIEYLESNGLITRFEVGGGKIGVQLENKGFDVFEKYNGWSDYKKKL